MQQTVMFSDTKSQMERQDTTIVALQRGQLQHNPNVGK